MSKVHFEIELDQHTVEQIDAWRDKQPAPLSHAEAAQRLLEAGLTAAGNNGGRFSDGEKLIMMMLRDLYRHQHVNGDIDPEFIQDALLGGHYWALRWQMSGLLHDDADSQRILSETLDILDMWWFIETRCASLSDEDKARLKKEATPFDADVRFPGFDGNNEHEHLGIAHFLINKMGRYEIFKGHYLNSHFPSIEGYRRMLSVFKPIRQNLGGSELSTGQIIMLLNARTHPEKR